MGVTRWVGAAAAAVVIVGAVVAVVRSGARSGGRQALPINAAWPVPTGGLRGS